MKTFVHIIILLLLLSATGYSQITSPVIRANFGVDADLRTNFFNGSVLDGNDDWFTQPGTSGTGVYVIDTTGAAAIVAQYGSSIPSRRATFSRGMSYPVLSIVNNHLLLDAAFVRDFHGDDSTVFASGSNKNGDSPGDWTCPVSQGIPDKNDILDMMVHVRRAGPTTSDSLWMMGGVSLDNTTGNRYFDFEMYQTDLVYNRSARTFTGYGPDAGHTSWEFDASGNIIKAGDIIFSAEYQSSSLTFIEARIWINQASLSITPTAFSWSGQFDGASAGATYGYASIQPNAGGTYYTGLQCANNTWGGPFSIILQDESIVTNYSAKQYVEFSVNLTKLGLDPAASITSNTCGMPFKSLLVKTRASASFTAELKDFVAPFIFFYIPEANVATVAPAICEEGSISTIFVNNPLSTSVYEWLTPDGNIVSTPTGQSIMVDTPGTYIVNQYLLSGCDTFATDTIQIALSSGCFPLAVDLFNFRGILLNDNIQLNWQVAHNQNAQLFEIERSPDGINFEKIGQLEKQSLPNELVSYSFADNITGHRVVNIYYRIRIIALNGTAKYSNIISIPFKTPAKNGFSVYPNPVHDIFQLEVVMSENSRIRFELYDPAGKLVSGMNTTVQRGKNIISFNELADKPKGIYLAVIYSGSNIYKEKILLMK